MRVLLSTYESHGDVEPLVGLAVQLRALGAKLLARVGVSLVTGATGVMTTGVRL